MAFKYGINLDSYVPGQEFRYGDMSDLDIELLCYIADRQPSVGGLGRIQHFMNAFWLAYPYIQKHEFTERIVRNYASCVRRRPDGTYFGELWLAGSAGSSKTYTVSACAQLDWSAFPRKSACVITGPVIGSLRRNTWQAIKEHWLGGPDAIFDPVKQTGRFAGLLTDSELVIRSAPGETKNAIFAVAVRSGNVNEAAGRIQGAHTDRVIIVIDEMPHVEEGIMKAVANLSIGNAYTIIIGIGNPLDKMDQHGQACEPAEHLGGWGENSEITYKDREWPTKSGGICLHFNGYDSPNVVAEKKLYRGIITKHDIEKTIEKYGEDSIEVWSYIYGFWAPEGLIPVVIPRKSLSPCKDELIFGGPTFLISACDPAFEGGDRCIQLIAECGPIKGREGTYGAQIRKIIDIKRKVSVKKLIHEQVADAIIANCRNPDMPVDPRHFALDVTGRGIGCHSILQFKLNEKIYAVAFGSETSEKKIRITDQGTPKELYDRYVTELYYLTKAYVEECQIGGLTDDIIKELSNRRYTISKEKKTSIEDKKEVKERTGKSPDLADSVVVLCALMRHLGYQPSAFGKRHNFVDERRAEKIRKVNKLLRPAFTCKPLSAMKRLYAPNIPNFR